jgi:uncharacterized protein (DUF58 family)
MSVTKRTAVFAACLSALVFVFTPAVAAGLIVALLVFAVVDALLVRSTPTATRSYGAFARGLPIPVVIGVSPTRWASRFEIRQPLGPDMRTDQLPVGSKRALEFSLTCLRRGRLELPALSIRQIGPLGLGSWRRRVGEPASIRVFADIPNANKLAHAVRLGAIRSTGQTRRGPLGLGTDFESVREYRADDDVRQINWKASARTGRAMANNLRVEQDRDVYCFIDIGRLVASPYFNANERWVEQFATQDANSAVQQNQTMVSDTWRSATRLDVLLDAVAAVALIADEVGDRIGMIAYSDQIVRHVSPARRGASGVIENSYDLEPALLESEPERAALSIGSPRSALVVMFTDLIDASAARSLVTVVAQLAQRHEVLLVSGLDPVLEEVAETGSGRSVAIASTLEATREAIARLRQAGAEVVCVQPYGLSAATARAYVAARSRPRKTTRTQ